MDNNEFQQRFFKLEAEVGQIEQKLASLIHENKLNDIIQTLSIINQKLDKMAQTLADVQAAVTAEDTVVDSAITLLTGLAAQVAALAPTQAAIDALAADITSKTKVLADAVVANTPTA